MAKKHNRAECVTRQTDLGCEERTHAGSREEVVGCMEERCSCKILFCFCKELIIHYYNNYTHLQSHFFDAEKHLYNRPLPSLHHSHTRLFGSSVSSPRHTCTWTSIAAMSSRLFFTTTNEHVNSLYITQGRRSRVQTRSLVVLLASCHKEDWWC